MLKSEKENKIYGVVYQITNIINGKFYIGQTTKNPPNKRFYEHRYHSRQEKYKSPISSAIKKYGEENFIFRVICICNTQEELNKKEEFFIQKYKSLIDENGYNLHKKTEGKGKHHQNTIKKMKDSYKNNPDRSKNLKKLILNNPKRMEQIKNLGKKQFNTKKEIATSKYIGVYKFEYAWRVRLHFNKKPLSFECYQTEIDAAKARDIYALKFYGNDAVLNFPELRSEYLNNNIIPEKYKRKKLYNSIKGVSFDKWNKKWQAYIYKNGISKKKRFTKKLDAEKCRLQWEKEL